MVIHVELTVPRCTGAFATTVVITMASPRGELHEVPVPVLGRVPGDVDLDPNGLVLLGRFDSAVGAAREVVVRRINGERLSFDTATVALAGGSASVGLIRVREVAQQSSSGAMRLSLELLPGLPAGVVKGSVRLRWKGLGAPAPTTFRFLGYCKNSRTRRKEIGR